MIKDRFRKRIEDGNLHPIHRYETFLRDELVPALQAGTYDPLNIPGEQLMYDTSQPDPASADRLVQEIGTLLARE